MRELRYKIDKVVDIDSIITNEIKNLGVTEYYRKTIKTSNKKIYVYVYEHIRKNYINQNRLTGMPTKFVVSTTVVAAVKESSTVVSVVLASDENYEINSIILALTSYGFSFVDSK